MGMNEEQLIETLFDCIERLMELLRETHNAEKAEEIYQDFFGN